MASYKPQVKQANGTMVDLPLDAATINGGLTVLKSVPADAKFSDTTYGVVTTSTNGLMSTTMLTKLNGIADGANKYTLPTAASGTLGGIKTGYTTSGKNYKVQVDSSGNAYVNVPWTDSNTTYGVATTSALGLVKSSTTGTTSGRDYVVQVNSDGTMKVNVPWTDSNTVYSAATSTTYGLVKIGYTTSGKNYAVQLDTDGKMYVNVPWTDTDTNTDTKVTQTVTTTDASYPLLLAPNGQTTSQTTTAYFDSGVTLNPSTNTIAANISGSAASATKATQDGDGKVIKDTYLKKTGGTLSGTIELTNGDVIAPYLAAKSAGHETSTYDKIATLSSTGYIRYRTKAELKADLGVPTLSYNSSTKTLTIT